MSKESKPLKVAGRFGVVTNTDGWDARGWRVAEIVGPTGLYITHGWYPDQRTAVKAATSYADKESAVSESNPAPMSPPFRPRTLNLYLVGPLEGAVDDNYYTEFVVAAPSAHEARLTCFKFCEGNSTSDNADLCEAAPVVQIGTTEIYLDSRVILATSIDL